jgi:hypothetical protein
MTDPLETVTESEKLLTHLIDVLSATYDQLYSQDIDIDELGDCLDGIIFANNKLQDQKIKLEAQRKDLRGKISAAYGEEDVSTRTAKKM